MSLGCVYESGLCDKLSQKTKLNRLNERDLELKMSIATNYIPGIDLNDVLFDKQGYVQNSTVALLDVMDAGLRRLYLDIYWDKVAGRWHLCPLRPIELYENTTMLPTSTAAVSTLHSRSADGGLTGTASPPIGLAMKEIYEASTNISEPTSGTGWKNGTQTTTISSGTIGNRISPNSSTPNGYYLPNSGIQCDYSLDFNTFVKALKQYIDLSDTNIAASLLYLHLRPKLWDVPSNETKVNSLVYTTGQTSINDTLAQLSSRILTPAKVYSYEVSNKYLDSRGQAADIPQSKLWPSLQSLLYTIKGRIVISYDDELTEQIPDLSKLNSLAFNAKATISNPANTTIDQLSRLNFTDTFVTTSDAWFDAKKLGVSPVISGSNYTIYSDEMFQLLDTHRYWLWSGDQPTLYTKEERVKMLKGGYKKSIKLYACAIITPVGLKVADCNSRYPVLCKNKTNSFDWLTTDEKHTYFDSSCPDGYAFGTPGSPLEARLLRTVIELASTEWEDSWVDFNSLFLPNCWITGGTNAICPYNVVENSRNGIAYISAAGAVAVVAFFFIALFEWDRGRSPIMRYSKKKSKVRPAEYQGIPS